MENKFKLKTGDVLTTYTPYVWYQPKTWMAPFIRWITKEKFTHSAVAIEIWDRVFICEALGTGIIVRPVEEFSDNMVVNVSRPKKRPMSDKDFCIKAMSKVGHTGFDYSSLLFHQIIYQISGKWTGWSKVSKKAEDKFYCSEYVAWLYESIFPEWHLVTPDVIFNSEAFETVYVGPDDTIH